MIAPSRAEIRMWQQEIAAMKRQKSSTPTEDLIVFYGSSSVRLWEHMQQDLQPYHTLNLGFGGSSYFWCNYFFQEAFEGVKAKHIVLYAGDNDLGSDHETAFIIQNAESLLAKIEAKYGDIPVSLISVKPSPERTYLKAKMLQLNASLNEMMSKQENRRYFVDVYHPMLSDIGEVQPDFYEADQLHMSRKGYLIWKRVLLEHLHELHA